MITNIINKVIYAGDGHTKEFLVPFPFGELSDLILILYNIETEEETEIASNWSYDENTHKITYPSFPVIGDAISEDERFVIYRKTPLTQEKNHEVRLFTSQDVETIADKLTREVQDIQEQVDRSIKYDVPHVGETNAQQYIDDLNEAKDVATAQAAIATAQANIATQQAGLAATSATNAATSATNAEKWAEGSDAEITPLGGIHSSKGWAFICQQLINTLGSVLRYKGSKLTYAELPQTGNEIGDMWNVTEDGANYAWDGTGWDALSGVVDLSEYRTASQQDSIDATKADITDIPVVNNAIITFTQGGTTKGTFTLNQSADQTIALDAGGGGGGGTWGSITGTLSDQTDLQTALDAKVNSSDYVAYTATEVETLWGSI